MSINSPLGRRNLASGQQPQPQQRVLSVPDESMMADDEEFIPRNPYAQGAVPTHLQPQMPTPQHLHPSMPQMQSNLDGVKDMRRERIASQQRVSHDARDRMNYLANIGRKTVDVTADNSVFTLQTLKSKEMRAALSAAAKFGSNTPEHYFTLRNFTMAYALHSVDNMTLDLILGDDSPEVVVAYMLEEMDDVVLDYLYANFLELHADQKNRFSLKTEKDMKEVAEDVKKS